MSRERRYHDRVIHSFHDKSSSLHCRRFQVVRYVAFLEHALVVLLTSLQQSCLAEGMPVSGCDPTDSECLCHSTPFTNAVGACLTANCTVVEALGMSEASDCKETC